MPENKIRAFLAIDLPEENRARAARCQDRLRRAVAEVGLDVGWVKPECLHVTLHFFGDIEEAAIDGITGALRQAMADQAGAVEIGLRSAGAFPTEDRPRVVYIGVTAADGGPPAAFCALQGAVVEAVTALGYPKEDRPYTPHLTLGRVRDRRRGRGQGSPFAGLVGESFGPIVKVNEIVLYESRQGRSGVTYIARARVPLGKETTGP